MLFASLFPVRYIDVHLGSASRCLPSWETGVLIIFEEKAGDLIMQIAPYINFLYKIPTVFGLRGGGGGGNS